MSLFEGVLSVIAVEMEGVETSCGCGTLRWMMIWLVIIKYIYAARLYSPRLKSE
jgi:hypothetical protein